MVFAVSGKFRIEYKKCMTEFRLESISMHKIIKLRQVDFNGIYCSRPFSMFFEGKMEYQRINQILSFIHIHIHIYLFRYNAFSYIMV